MSVTDKIVESSLQSFEVDKSSDEVELDVPLVEHLPTLESILSEETKIVEDETYQNDVKKASSKRGHLLRHVRMRSVTSQIQSAISRVSTGKPTVVTVNSHIAVGTFNGIVLVFDAQQTLKWCFGTSDFGILYGAVSALSIASPNIEHLLLSGHDLGVVNLWDLTTGSMIASVVEDRLPRSAVIFAKFSAIENIAICSECGGSVFKLHFRKTFSMYRKCEVSCLFSGCNGEVVAMEPLLSSAQRYDHPVIVLGLVALATVTKIIVISLKPCLKVLFTFQLKSSYIYSPSIAWNFSFFKKPGTDEPIHDPILAFGRNDTIHFFHAKLTSSEKVEFLPLRKITMDHSFQFLCWMSSKAIATLDTYECLHLTYVRTEEELDSLDLADVELVYATPFFKGVATGGNVSRAMSVIANHACANSVVATGCHLLLLGLNSLHIVSIRSWKERIDFFVKRKCYLDALEVCSMLYEGKTKMLVEYEESEEERRAIIIEKSRFIIRNVLDLLIYEYENNELELETLTLNTERLVHYCFTFDLRDILFSEAFQIYSKLPITLGIFFQALEPYIIKKKLPNLPSEFCKSIIEFYSLYKKFDILERIILGINPTALNIPQIISLCQQNQLFSTYLYLCNVVMHIYDAPLEELLILLQSSMKSSKALKKNMIELGNQLLMYISCCLTGVVYPLGDIRNDDEAVMVKNYVFYLILRPYGVEGKVKYPHLNTLLQFETREFLNVVTLSFLQTAERKFFSLKQKQNFVNILVDLMINNLDFNPSQVGSLFIFIARILVIPRVNVTLNQSLLEQVIEYLINPDDEVRVEERQQVLLELYRAGFLKSIEPSRLLMLADKARFYQVCEELYEVTRQFDKIVSCYLNDKCREKEVFSFVHQIMNSSNHSSTEILRLKNKVLEELEPFANLDLDKTCELIENNFFDDMEFIVSNSQISPQVLYKLLERLLEYNTDDSKLKLTPRIVADRYVALTCELCPERLREVLEKTTGYQNDKAIEVCTKHGFTDAVIFLLEKSGDTYGAFKVLFDDLQNKIQPVYDTILHDQKLKNTTVWKEFDDKLKEAIQFCQRHSQFLKDDEKENFWFSLLDLLISPQKRMKAYMRDEHTEVVKDAMKDLILNMSGPLPLKNIIKQILQNPVCTSGTFGEIRTLLMSMFESCSYESLMLSTCVTIHRHDLYDMMTRLWRRSTKAVAYRSLDCIFCQKPLEIRDHDFVAIGCGHLMHLKCVGDVDDARRVCPVCRPARLRHLASSISTVSSGTYESKVSARVSFLN